MKQMRLDKTRQRGDRYWQVVKLSGKWRAREYSLSVDGKQLWFQRTGPFDSQEDALQQVREWRAKRYSTQGFGFRV